MCEMSDIFQSMYCIRIYCNKYLLFTFIANMHRGTYINVMCTKHAKHYFSHSASECVLVSAHGSPFPRRT